MHGKLFRHEASQVYSLLSDDLAKKKVYISMYICLNIICNGVKYEIFLPGNINFCF